MLLPYTTLVYYGPGAAAAVGVSVSTASATIRADGILRAVDTSVATAVARVSNGRRMAAVDVALATAFVTLKGRGRLGAVGKIGALSQDDVTGAVLEAVIEDGLSLKEALRLLLAYAAGDATGLDTNPIFKSMDGSKTRLAGTISAGTRTITTKDAS